MADITGYNRSETVPTSGAAIPKKYHDNGDGTYSEQIYGGGGTLPTGAATEAKQDAEITHLATIAGVSKGSGVVDASTQRVVLASDGPTVTVLGTTADAAVVTDAAGTLSGKLRGLVKMLADVWDSANHFLKSAPQLYNGATYEAERGNYEGTLLASGARTATTNTADQTNVCGRGVIVYLNITLASGTGGLQPIVQGLDPVSGAYCNLNNAPTAITTTGMKGVAIYPGAAAGNVGNFVAMIQSPLPRTWRVSVTHGDSSSYTYSLGYCVIEH